MDKAPEILAQICERVATGESVRSISADEVMPSMSTIFRWLTEDTDFQEQYARAKQAACEVLAAELLEIADDGTNDYVDQVNQRTGQTETAFDAEHVQRSKLRVDTRKWYLSKIVPKVYGDRTGIELTGKDGGPIQTDDSTAAAKLAALLEDLRSRKEKDGSDLV